MSGPRIVCVGAAEESEAVLTHLLEAGANVVGLVTLPPEASASVSDYVDLRPICEEFEVSVVTTTNINDAGTLAEIGELDPEFVYTLGWSQLFKDELLTLPSRYVVGSHPSLLPAGRGRAPIPWTILEDAESSAVSLFRMDIGVDSGPVLVQRIFDIPAGSDSRSLYDLMVENLSQAFGDLYAMHASGEEIVAVEQDSTQATYRGKRTPADGHLDFELPATELDRLIRAATRPYPGAYTYYDGRLVRVWRSSLEDLPAYSGTTGQVLLRDDGKLLVQAGDGTLWLTEISGDDELIEPADLRVGKRLGYRVEDTLHRLEQEIAALKRRLE